MTYTITLQDAKFQNGDELKASDVVFSYESAMQNSRFNYVTSFINKVEAQDDKTVVITLDYPYSAISHTFWTVKIFSQREYEETVASGVEFGTKPHTAGTGPYIIKEFDAEGVSLVAFEDYWGGAPAIKNIRYRTITEDAAALIAFENNELDYFKDVPTTDWESVVKTAGEDHSAMVKANDIQWLAVNYLSPTNNNILGNAKVREAIAWAINKQDLIQVCTSGLGYPAYEYMPHEYVATSPNYQDGTFNTYDHDLDKAHQCLLDAGFTEDEIAAGIDVGTILTYGSDTAHKGKACVVIQSNLAEAVCSLRWSAPTTPWSVPACTIRITTCASLAMPATMTSTISASRSILSPWVCMLSVTRTIRAPSTGRRWKSWSMPVSLPPTRRSAIRSTPSCGRWSWIPTLICLCITRPAAPPGLPGWSFPL